MMKRKVLLLSLLVAGLAATTMWVANSAAESQPADKQAAVSGTSEAPGAIESDTVKAAPEVVAYYFHTTYRCGACKRIEAYTKEAVETGFTEELRSGRLKFESVNIQEDQNKHFVDEFKLYTKSVVICNMENGEQVEWKNLARVWQLTRNKDAFVKYVQDEIHAYLKES